jgi:hypothetical protein
VSSAHERRTFAGFLAHLVRRPWWRNPLLALVGFTALASLAHQVGLLNPIERFVSDLTLVFTRGPRPDHVVTVAVGGAQCDDEFAGRSPLDARGPDGRGVLEALIVRIAAARPRVIVIDIDTAHPTFADLSEARRTTAGGRQCAGADLVPRLGQPRGTKSPARLPRAAEREPRLQRFPRLRHRQLYCRQRRHDPTVHSRAESGADRECRVSFARLASHAGLLRRRLQRRLRQDQKDVIRRGASL